MPMDYKRYPANWREISRSIRFDRAKNRCEWCGVPNYALILRSTKDGAKYLILKDDGIHYTPEGEPVRLSLMDEEFDANPEYTRVILTVAHLGITKPDGTPGDKADTMDCRPENLAALCQRCHLLFDMPENIPARRRTYYQHVIEQLELSGQMRLIEVHP